MDPNNLWCNSLIKHVTEHTWLQLFRKLLFLIKLATSFNSELGHYFPFIQYMCVVQIQTRPGYISLLTYFVMEWYKTKFSKQLIMRKGRYEVWVFVLAGVQWGRADRACGCVAALIVVWGVNESLIEIHKHGFIRVISILMVQ